MIQLNINWQQFFNLLSPWGLPLIAACLILFAGPFLKNRPRFSFVFSVSICLLSLALAWNHWLVAQETVIGFLIFDKISYFRADVQFGCACCFGETHDSEKLLKSSVNVTSLCDYCEGVFVFKTTWLDFL